MTVDQIVEETRSLPQDVVAELVDRILLTMHGGEEPEGRAPGRAQFIAVLAKFAADPCRASGRSHGRQDPADRRPVKPHAFHPEADAEYAEAAQHYAQIQPDLGGRFYDEIEAAIGAARTGSGFGFGAGLRKDGCGAG